MYKRQAKGEVFLSPQTIGIVILGLLAFCFGTAGGVLFGKLMYSFTKGKVNPLIGSAGVSAVPMAARVSQKVGQEENPGNFLLMHAMGPNVDVYKRQVLGIAGHSVRWSSSAPSVASVSDHKVLGKDYSSATVSGKKKGQATITATVAGKEASCTVTVH